MVKEIPEDILEKIKADSRSKDGIKEATPYRTILGVSVFQRPCTIVEYMVEPQNGNDFITEFYILQDGKTYTLKELISRK